MKGLGLRRLMPDILHRCYLGVVNSWVICSLWCLISNIVWGTNSEHLSVARLGGALSNYSRRRRGQGVTQSQWVTWAWLGTGAKPAAQPFKGADAKHIAQFVIKLLVLFVAHSFLRSFDRMVYRGIGLSAPSTTTFEYDRGAGALHEGFWSALPSRGHPRRHECICKGPPLLHRLHNAQTEHDNLTSYNCCRCEFKPGLRGRCPNRLSRCVFSPGYSRAGHVSSRRGGRSPRWARVAHGRDQCNKAQHHPQPTSYVLCYITLRCGLLSCVVQCLAMLCSVVLCVAVLRCALRYCTVLSCAY